MPLPFYSQDNAVFFQDFKEAVTVQVGNGTPYTAYGIFDLVETALSRNGVPVSSTVAKPVLLVSQANYDLIPKNDNDTPSVRLTIRTVIYKVVDRQGDGTGFYKLYLREV